MGGGKLALQSVQENPDLPLLPGLEGLVVVEVRWPPGRQHLEPTMIRHGLSFVWPGGHQSINGCVQTAVMGRVAMIHEWPLAFGNYR